jgi:hypothetical protein
LRRGPTHREPRRCPFEPKANPDADLERRQRRFSAAYDGFDVHCAVRIAADDDAGRERLVRYCTRPPFALERIELLRDGRVAYLLKAARNGRTHRVMTPMDFMARLAALVPPPKIPLVRYHGVFAPRSSWRALVTPKPPARGCLSKTAALAPGSHLFPPHRRRHPQGRPTGCLLQLPGHHARERHRLGRQGQGRS